MSGALGWIGWAVAVALAIYSLGERHARIRATNAARRLTNMESTKLALEALNTSSQNHQAQLTAISDALGSDSPARPDAATLERLAAFGNLKYDALVKHLRSRERARKELPIVVSQLDGIQARRMAYEQDISVGLPIKNDSIGQLRDELRQVGEHLASLIRELVESPRIYVSDKEPKEAADGDLWFYPEDRGSSPI